ncbi:MAG: hypothetical protein E3K36_16480 [Candidatus Brocadia sp.]|nr:hypothetical protein [Candidatus Brocadia sp.]
MMFFKGKNAQQLKQPGGNDGREKNTKQRITVYLFVIFHGISVQSNSASNGIGKKSMIDTAETLSYFSKTKLDAMKGYKER